MGVARHACRALHVINAPLHLSLYGRPRERRICRVQRLRHVALVAAHVQLAQSHCHVSRRAGRPTEAQRPGTAPGSELVPEALNPII